MIAFDLQTIGTFLASLGWVACTCRDFVHTYQRFDATPLLWAIWIWWILPTCQPQVYKPKAQGETGSNSDEKHMLHKEELKCEWLILMHTSEFENFSSVGFQMIYAPLCLYVQRPGSYNFIGCDIRCRNDAIISFPTAGKKSVQGFN